MSKQLIFEKGNPGRIGYTLPKMDVPYKENLIPESLLSIKELPLPEVSELDVIRHYSRLADKNFSVDANFYPLGSCTMKYNPRVNEIIAGICGLTQIHPYQNEETVQGAMELMYLLEKYLCEIAGMDAFTLQPAAGAHGELTALLMTKKWFELKKENRTSILVPDSSHGTNPASAAMAGMNVIQIASNENGTVNLEDLEKYLDENTACFMMTNPNTLGIFETDIVKIAGMVHEKGGLLYYDGANLNATMGIVRPGDAGFDFVHINVHKTFSTPHGGGGPGAGPVGAKNELVKLLPVPRIIKDGDKYRFNYDSPDSIGRVKAFYGNFSVLVKTLAYILTLGKEDIRQASEMAVLNANYMLSKLKNIFAFPYGDLCMHEFVASSKPQKEKGVKATDICKRLLDLGFHAPTVYFPLIVEEALMIEPTETESKETLDAFIEAIEKIQTEIDTNPEIVTSAPHTMPVKRLDDVLAARKPNLHW